MSVIPATWEVEIRRIMVQGQPWPTEQTKIPYLNNNSKKIRGAEGVLEVGNNLEIN
jgi:hypothetical protein